MIKIILLGAALVAMASHVSHSLVTDVVSGPGHDLLDFVNEPDSTLAAIPRP